MTEFTYTWSNTSNTIETQLDRLHTIEKSYGSFTLQPFWQLSFDTVKSLIKNRKKLWHSLCLCVCAHEHMQELGIRPYLGKYIVYHEPMNMHDWVLGNQCAKAVQKSTYWTTVSATGVEHQRGLNSIMEN